MSRHDDNITLRQILDHAREAMKLTQERSRTDFDTDRVWYLAMIQLLQILGEAVSRLSQSYRNTYPKIPWNEIISLRNRLIHGYNEIDKDIVWKIINTDLPALVESIEKIIESDK